MRGTGKDDCGSRDPRLQPQTSLQPPECRLAVVEQV